MLHRKTALAGFRWQRVDFVDTLSSPLSGGEQETITVQGGIPMNDAYDVSVVIPVHNTNPRMFDHVVESMFSQTLGFDRVEWIVVLHNCREDCAAYVHEKLDGHPNVLIVPLDNEAHSPSSPRNHGLRMARGEFIGFLDADDGYTPACLEKALRYIRETDADVCHFRRKVELEKEGGLILNELVLWDQTRETIVVSRDTWDGTKLFVSTWAMCTSKLYRRSFLLENDLFFDDTVKFAEDYDFVFGVYGKARRIVLAPQLIGYIYFVNSESLVQTTRVTPELLMDYVHGFKKLFDKGISYGLYMNETIGNLLLMVVIWMKMCPDLSEGQRAETREILRPYIQDLKPVAPSKIYYGGRDERQNTLPWKVILQEDAVPGTYIDRAVHTLPVTLIDRQRDALNEVIRRSAKSDFSKRYGLSRMLTIEEYCEKSPVTDDGVYEPMVRLTTEIGEEGIFTDDEITAYAYAYRGGNAPKRIPFTARSLAPYVDAFSEAVGASRTFLMLESLPFRPSRLTMDVKYTNTLMGLILTEYTARGLKSPGTSARFTTPAELLFPEKIYDSSSVRLVFALADPDVETIYAPNAWILFGDLRRLYLGWSALCEDIRLGRISAITDIPKEILEKLSARLFPHPERAEQLRKIFEQADGKPTLSQIWPKLKRVFANISGSYAFYRKAVLPALGDIPLIDLPLQDEAAFYGRPAEEGGCLLDADNAFFEFVPAGWNPEKETLLVNALRQGEEYETLVSNMAGLCRYRTGMTLRCEEADEQRLRVSPCCPADYDLASFHGVREEDVVEAVRACEQSLGESLADFTFMPGAEKGRFALALEPYTAEAMNRMNDAAVLRKLANAAEKALRRIRPAFPEGALNVFPCEPETHLLYQELQQFSRGVLKDAIAPVHMTDDPAVIRHFRQ